VTATAGDGAVVCLREIRKAYGPVVAVRDVSLALAAGEIRALLGENGAGKTTLMNVLFGIARPDAGRILVEGRDVTAGWSPRRAIAHGIGMIHQHFSLVAEHTVLENVVMPILSWRDLRPVWSRHRAAVDRLSADHGFALPLDAPVETLSVGQRQQVEILKMLVQGARVLVLDEPTGVLTPQQSDALLEMLRRLAGGGHTVVLITHKLREALAVAARITVLRRGALVATIERADAAPEDIARLMVDHVEPRGPRGGRPAHGEAAVEIADAVVNGPHGRAVDGVTLAIRAGEILGVAGVAGNGQSEIAEALVGYRALASGRIRVGNVDVTTHNVRDRRRRGIAFIPEDRHHLGLVPDMTVAGNLVLDRADDPAFSRLGILRISAIRRWAERQMRDYDIRAAGPAAAAATLSGGNQQKVVLGRALASAPRVVVAAEPTRGLDLGAAVFVRQRLVDCARRGVGILLISSDLEELLELSHRIAVIYRGRVAGTLTPASYDARRIGRLMAGLAE
jgi:general nucleoside transport system ATP-binding protein